MVIKRDTLSVFDKMFFDKKIYPPDGYRRSVYSCQQINDDTIFDTLKDRFESRLAITKKNKQDYDNRPNKL